MNGPEALRLAMVTGHLHGCAEFTENFLETKSVTYAPVIAHRREIDDTSLLLGSGKGHLFNFSFFDDENKRRQHSC